MKMPVSVQRRPGDQRSGRRLGPFLLFAVIAFGTAQAQYLPDNASFWWMKTDDDVLHYVLELGKGQDADKTFIVLHGGYGAEHSYLITPLLELSKDYRFVLYDQRGSLRTEAPADSIRFPRLVDDLDALRSELGLEKVQLIGHSNGAMLALDYLATYPDRVGRLILLAPPLSFVHDEIFGGEALDEAIARYRSLHAERVEQIEQSIKRKLNALGLADSQELSGREHSIRSKVEAAAWNTTSTGNWPRMQNAFFSPRVFEALQENHSAEAWRERSFRKSRAFVATGVPIRVILGQQDFSDPEGYVWRYLVEQAKDSQLTLLEQAGHMPWFDQAAAFSRRLERYLED